MSNNRILIILAAAAVLGCSEVSAPVEQPLFNFSNGPANPGNSGVFRFQGLFTLRLDYPDQGLIVRHYAADNSFEVCGGSQTFPSDDEQAVTDLGQANAVIKLLVQEKNVPVLIYPPYLGDKAFCDFLASDWLYKGTGSLRFNDNNFDFDPSRTDAYRWAGQGTVYDHAGKKHQYNEMQKFTIDPDPFVVHVERVEISIH